MKQLTIRKVVGLLILVVLVIYFCFYIQESELIGLPFPLTNQLVQRHLVCMPWLTPHLLVLPPFTCLTLAESRTYLNTQAFPERRQTYRPRLHRLHHHHPRRRRRHHLRHLPYHPDLRRTQSSHSHYRYLPVPTIYQIQPSRNQLN